jgi:HEAT repeat protein
LTYLLLENDLHLPSEAASMKKTERYRQKLNEIQNWDDFLMAESNLPGPRGNLELVQAVADQGDEALFLRYISYGPVQAFTGSPQEILPVCGAVGLGRLVAEGREEFLPVLRDLASDPRWRIREGVAMALQRVGEANMDRLLAEMESWSQGERLVQRAAAAGLAEPVLLKDPRQVQRVLEIFDRITTSIEGAGDRESEHFKILRQAMGYCWSVAVAALPKEGKPAMEKWLQSPDRDVRWVMRENLKKNRLARMDPDWVARARARIEKPSNE